MPNKHAGAGDPWSGPAISALEFWASFWPTAPLFGVEWRYADMAAKWNPFLGFAGTMPGAYKAAAKTAKLAGAAAADMAKVAAPAVEVPAVEVPAAKAPVAEAAVVEAAPKSAAPQHAVSETTAPETVTAEKAPEVEAAADQSSVASDIGEPDAPASLMVVPPKDADDLTVIKGIGPGLARQLNGLGVYKLDQIAGFSKTDLSWIDANLSSFKGRCFRDDWTGQAKALLG